MNKMVKELAILGFVSFTATVIMQFIHLTEDKKMLFEYAHVLMFGTAIAYAKEIALISSQLHQITEAFGTADRAGERRRAPATPARLTCGGAQTVQPRDPLVQARKRRCYGHAPCAITAHAGGRPRPK